jgi:cellobiose phosphorylase
MLNIYNPRQCWATFNWSRDLSLYQLGFGGRGVGFRDSSQDVMGILANNPLAGKELLRKLLQVQKKNGSAMHQFNLSTMVATEGDSSEREDRPHYYSDDHLWVVLAVCAYLKESGEIDFLEETLPFYDKDHQDRPIEEGTVWEHLRRSVEFTHQDRGAHGLPLLGFADWNDTINLPTGAESLLTANLYGKALLEIIQLCQVRQDLPQAKIYQGWYEEMKSKVNEQAWDGDWYISYMDADGTPLGSHKSPAGKIYAYGQAWPVISGFAEDERKQKALEGVFKYLNTPNGIKVSAPGFNGYDPAKGGITTYPPGAKENCGIFLHVNPWVVIAEALAGNGERAYAYYAQINPASKNDRVDEYECEVYVYPQNMLGDEHPQFGLARNSWLSGTASWMYQAGIQYILGVRPNYQGLEIDPCIPAQWNGFKVKRWFRGASYEIEVVNPQHVNRGVASVEVDGRGLRERVVPVFGDGKTHTVLVKLGKR